MKLDNSCSLFVRRSCLPSSEARIDSTRIESLKHTATLYLHLCVGGGFARYARSTTAYGPLLRVLGRTPPTSIHLWCFGLKKKSEHKMSWTKQVWNGWFHEVQLCQTNQRCESAFLWQWGGHWDTKFVHGKPSQVVVVNLAMLKKIDRKLTSMWNHETSQVDWKDGQVDETEPKKRPYKP